MRKRIEVLHGVNLDMLGKRPVEHYGNFGLAELETQIDGFARDLGLEVTCFQTNSEDEYIERLHRAPELADGLILNPGAWTHYSWAIHDALEIAGLPAVEVHLSDVNARDEWRKTSVIKDSCLLTVSGKGPDGYQEALAALKQALENDA